MKEYAKGFRIRNHYICLGIVFRFSIGLMIYIRKYAFYLCLPLVDLYLDLNPEY